MSPSPAEETDHEKYGEPAHSQAAMMRKLSLCLKLVGIFVLSMVFPTSFLTARVDRILAQLQDLREADTEVPPADKGPPT